MVAKKSDVKKSVTGNKKVAVKSGVEKTAIKKLKEEVNKTKVEVVKKQHEDKVSAENVANNKEKKENKKENKAPMFIKIDTKQKVQNEGKIGEIKHGVAYATGHRKRSIAKVACKEKSGKLSISVNNLEYNQFFTKLLHQNIVMAPFVLLGIKTGYVVKAEVFGGGKSGQADALKLGLSRCLSVMSEEYAKVLRKNSFLTRDARKVEPKKAGLKKARKKEQFSKR